MHSEAITVLYEQVLSTPVRTLLQGSDWVGLDVLVSYICCSNLNWLPALLKHGPRPPLPRSFSVFLTSHPWILLIASGSLNNCWFYIFQRGSSYGFFVPSCLAATGGGFIFTPVILSPKNICKFASTLSSFKCYRLQMGLRLCLATSLPIFLLGIQPEEEFGRNLFSESLLHWSASSLGFCPHGGLPSLLHWVFLDQGWNVGLYWWDFRISS